MWKLQRENNGVKTKIFSFDGASNINKTKQLLLNQKNLLGFVSFILSDSLCASFDSLPPLSLMFNCVLLCIMDALAMEAE